MYLRILRVISSTQPTSTQKPMSSTFSVVVFFICDTLRLICLCIIWVLSLPFCIYAVKEGKTILPFKEIHQTSEILPSRL